jgi:hypothetical protein
VTAKRRVALVSADLGSRQKLASYLGTVGFDVDECTELGVPSAYSAVVMLARDDAAAAAIEAQVRTWIEAAKPPRVVVVTSKPTAFRELLIAHARRLFVLAAPVFGWDVVDALRAVRLPRRA